MNRSDRALASSNRRNLQSRLFEMRQVAERDGTKLTCAEVRAQRREPVLCSGEATQTGDLPAGMVLGRPDMPLRVLVGQVIKRCPFPVGTPTVRLRQVADEPRADVGSLA